MKIKNRFLLLLISGLFCVEANSYYEHIFSLNFSGDKCRRWSKINPNKIPSDLDILSIHGPVKKIIKNFIVNDKPDLTVVAYYDKKGVLIERIGTYPEQIYDVKLNSETLILMPYFNDQTRINTVTNYDVTINKNKSTKEDKFIQIRQIRLWDSETNYARNYVTKLLRLKVKGNNSKSSNINLKIENTHLDLQTLLYNPKRRSLFHEYGRAYNSYKLNYRTKYDTFDDKDPIPSYDYYDWKGRLMKQTSETGTEVKLTWQYRWDKNSRVKILKYSRSNSNKYTETTYSYTKSHYTASISDCDEKKCKLKSEKTKPCYKRDKYGNALEQFDKVNLTLKGDEKVIKVKVSYEYYK